MPQRVIAYVDGFNLYYGLKDKGWRRYYWLNIPLLAQNILKPGQELIVTKYFTARVSSPLEKQKRQSTFLEALGTLTGIEMFYGHYQLNPRKCHKCGYEDRESKEKMTDVNIAVELLRDAYDDKCDVALLISADSDLVPPIKAVTELFPHKRIVAAFPPNRYSFSLDKVAHASFRIGRARIANSILPEEIVKTDGAILRRPDSWR
ncbi:MAG: 6-hydroxy-3-succinoylpyridine 3-monooxygenase HspA [Syntrophomonadaceae bacterium]|nr:6-hydroxy-3-succinoylpyridine 3-monooxygenase HspA [Bacillota bacterium]MBT9148497.1 6-hydroxy-3-succinoylpyridine 3-monooxygenase HspA [Bacillota bacterium]